MLGAVNLLHHAATRGACVVQALRIYGDVWDNLINSLSTSLSSLAQLSELELDILPEDVDGVWLAGVDSIMTKLLESAGPPENLTHQM